LRDWLPCLMMPLVYWQAGEFFLCANSDLQQLLVETDRIVVGPVVGWISRLRTRRWIAGILETAYLLCYPTIPMSVGVCYLLHIRRSLDYFWAVVLLSTYVSYIALAFFQTLPPRMLPEPWLKRLPPNPVRALNLWILAKASTHVNTFPSAHVAASMAIALALLRLAPWPAGVVFLGLALTIAIAAFLGRYHFVLDAVTGTIIAILIFSGVTAAGVLHGT
jgi:membrane-associated phospholipid phosphatase